MTLEPFTGKIHLGIVAPASSPLVPGRAARPASHPDFPSPKKDFALILSQREQRIVALVAEGLTNREIAHVCGTTEHVIKNYLKEIFDKTGMNSRLELALWWLRSHNSAQASD